MLSKSPRSGKLESQVSDVESRATWNREEATAESSTILDMMKNKNSTISKVSREFKGDLEINVENGNQYMGINLKDSSLDGENVRGCRLVWSRLGELRNGSFPISVMFLPLLVIIWLNQA